MFSSAVPQACVWRDVLVARPVGSGFPLDILEAIVDPPEGAVFDALEEAERAQLVAPEASRAARDLERLLMRCVPSRR